jgi:hypothetical protein
MSDFDIRTRQLQQIPVFALRQAVSALMDAPGMEVVFQGRLREVLGRRSRTLKRAVQRLTREQLTRLINACPEITDEEVRVLFEEYRYGTSPSFYIYLFDAGRVPHDAWQGFRPRFEAALEVFNKPLEKGLARIRCMRLNDLIALPDRPVINEGTYRFLARLDYIDEDENVQSVYQTLYGFFWVHTTLGYAIIQARSPEVLGGLLIALGAGARGIVLQPLVISKYLKNELTFLSRNALRSSRLYDPDPQTQRFRWLTIADDDTYGKGYDQWEERYPEVRNLRYREIVGEDRETSLTIRCDQAAFGLAGKLKASEFRAWCLDRLGQLVMTLDQMRANVPQFVQTHNLANAPEMSTFDAGQREQILRVISVLLTAKQTSGQSEQHVSASPLELAAALGPLVGVLVHFDHPTHECEEEGDVTCPECGGQLFTLIRNEAMWHLVCKAGTKAHWTGALPLPWRCEQAHAFTIGEDDLARTVILVPVEKLSQTIRRIVNLRLPGYRFDPEREAFYIRSSSLIYSPNRKQVTAEAKTEILVLQEIQNMSPGATVTGVEVHQVVGSVSVHGNTERTLSLLPVGVQHDDSDNHA